MVEHFTNCFKELSLMIDLKKLKRIRNYESLMAEHEKLVSQKNHKLPSSNGIFHRYENPIITAAHLPIHWRYDLNANTNPQGLERIGVNATFNAGAIKWRGKYVLAVRVEGYDRKSYFAFAESNNRVDNFNFWKHPLVLPQNGEKDINVYDMRLVEHQDGYIY